MKTLTIFFSLSLAFGALALAEPSPSPKASHTPASTNSPNEMNGAVVEFVPGQNLVLNTGTQNQHFKLNGQVQYFNPKGKAIAERKLKKDRKVRVHYAKQGDDMVVDRVTIVREGHKNAKAKKSPAAQ